MVRLEFLSWLTEMLGIEAASEAIVEQKIEQDETVKHLFNQLAVTYHAFGQIVFDVEAQKLTGRAVILLNGRQLELVGGLETKLSDGDTLTFIPPIEGG